MLLSSKSLVAMIHLPPLPGSTNYDSTSIRKLRDRAVMEAELLQEAGFSSIMIQNTHDRPAAVEIGPPAVAAMAVITAAVDDVFDGQIGVNVHKNDAVAALSIAHACAADYVRIKVLVGAVVGPEGIIEGNQEAAQRQRSDLDSGIEIWADLRELTSWPLAPTSIENLADLAVRFGGADRLIVTYQNVEESLAAIGAIRGVTDRPVLVGGRTNETNIRQALRSSDGVIVGTTLRVNSKTSEPLDKEAIERFVASVNGKLDDQ